MEGIASETEPLLRAEVAIEESRTDADRTERIANEQDLGEFDCKHDPDDPREWSATFKWAITLILTYTAFTV